MSDYDDLQKMMDKSAQHIARSEPDPSLWLAWVVYLLQRLETEARDARQFSPGMYSEMLEGLRDALKDRLERKHW